MSQLGTSHTLYQVCMLRGFIIETCLVVSAELHGSERIKRFSREGNKHCRVQNLEDSRRPWKYQCRVRVEGSFAGLTSL